MSYFSSNRLRRGTETVGFGGWDTLFEDTWVVFVDARPAAARNKLSSEPIRPDESLRDTPLRCGRADVDGTAMDMLRVRVDLLSLLLMDLLRGTGSLGSVDLLSMEETLIDLLRETGHFLLWISEAEGVRACADLLRIDALRDTARFCSELSDVSLTGKLRTCSDLLAIDLLRGTARLDGPAVDVSMAETLIDLLRDTERFLSWKSGAGAVRACADLLLALLHGDAGPFDEPFELAPMTVMLIDLLRDTERFLGELV